MAHERILIVDGDIALSQMLRNRLEAEGFLVDYARTGTKALDILKNEWVDLVILSVLLRGGMDGFHLFKEIRKRKKFLKIPIVVHSGKPGMKQLFERIGAEAFLTKPCPINLVLNKVKDILAD